MSIFIITHKKFNQPTEEGYKTLLVGAYRGHIFGDYFDDTGENISEKNPYYCELTGLYWLWKNNSDDYIGIVHYRRFFSKYIDKRKLLKEKDIKKKLVANDIILPNKVNIFQPIKKQLLDCYENYPQLLFLIRKAVEKNYPEYLMSYDKVMDGTETYFCNMMICSKKLFDSYCQWLFTILFDIEKQVDMSIFDNYQKRLYGFIAERLLTVWIEHNKVSVCEIGIVNIENDEGKKKELLKGIRRVFTYYFSESVFVRTQIDKIRKKQLQKQ